MKNLTKTISVLARDQGRWKRLMRGATPHSPPFCEAIPTRLVEVRTFGTNPGNLRMFSYAPAHLADNPALLVVLHGCTQSAASYNHGAGWSALADRHGFVLVLPEQQRSNNPNGCFSWYQRGDIERGRGEALSIRQMVEKTVMDEGIDPRRVFITGLSAGGAMASVMLACYPEIFAGGAIIAGLPYGAAANVQQAFESMFESPARSAQEWGDLVRGASPHDGPWPRISVWHGDADKTVIPRNAHEILKQWTNVHGLPTTPSSQAIVDGYPRQVWTNETGDELIESYMITNMAHGTPLAAGGADGKYGTAGPFLLEVGISSSDHIAKFFGLTGDFTQLEGRRSEAGTPRPTHEVGWPAAALTGSGVLEGEVLDRKSSGISEGTHIPPPSRIDIGTVITNALKSVGLMRGR